MSTNPPQPSKTAELTWREFPKFGTFAFAITYALGYWIVSIHNAYFGIPGSTPFRSKLISAGALFIVFIGIPILAARRREYFRDYFKLDIKSRVSRWTHVAVLLNAGAFSAITLAFFFRMIFGDYWSARVPIGVRYYPLIVILLSTVSPLIIQHWQSRFPKVCLMAVWLNLLILNGVVLALIRGTFVEVVYWFFVIGILAVMVPEVFKKAQANRALDWETHFLIIVFAVTVFALRIYGNVKPWYGGGLPVYVELQLRADDAKGTAAEGRGFLLDETDFGFYMVTNPGSREAYFVPRDRVTKIVYHPEKMGSFL